MTCYRFLKSSDLRLLPLVYLWSDILVNVYAIYSQESKVSTFLGLIISAESNSNKAERDP